MMYLLHHLHTPLLQAEGKAIFTVYDIATTSDPGCRNLGKDYY